MIFTDLYRIAENSTGSSISVENLRRQVKAHHPTIGDVLFNACDLDRSVSYGHMILFLERSSPYEDEYITACIRFDRTLNNAWARFVCTKELMHVFDASLEQASNRERFLQLMDELENRPITPSRMLISETRAEWMALIVLCPARLRGWACEQHRQGIPLLKIASILRIPSVYMRSIIGNNYSLAFEELTGESLKVSGTG